MDRIGAAFAVVAIAIYATIAMIPRCDAQHEGGGDAFLAEFRAIRGMAQEVAAAVARPEGPTIEEAPGVLEGRVRDWLAANRPDVSLQSLTMVMTGEPGQGPYWHLRYTLEDSRGTRSDGRLCFDRLGEQITCPARQVPTG